MLGLRYLCISSGFTAHFPRARPLLSPPCEGGGTGGKPINLDCTTIPGERPLLSPPCEGGVRGGGPIGLDCARKSCLAQSIEKVEGASDVSPRRMACPFRTSLWSSGEYVDDAEAPWPTPLNPPFARGGKVSATARSCATKTFVRCSATRPDQLNSSSSQGNPA